MINAFLANIDKIISNQVEAFDKSFWQKCADINSNYEITTFDGTDEHKSRTR